MCCYSRTNQGLDQIEYHFLNSLHIPSVNIIDQNNINRSLYNYYNISNQEIISINNILNDKEKLISDNWKDYQTKYNVKGKKGAVIQTVIQNSIKQNVIVPEGDKEDIKLTINGKNIRFYFINNEFYDSENINISNECKVNYTIN